MNSYIYYIFFKKSLILLLYKHYLSEISININDQKYKLLCYKNSFFYLIFEKQTTFNIFKFIKDLNVILIDTLIMNYI